jgi:CheY-like chemotaxis protein
MLIVDDSDNDVELMLAALEKYHFANPVDVARDGVEALDYLHCREAFAFRTPVNPALILLDIKMPRVDGLEVLKQIRADPALKMIPVVILTSSREQRDIVEGYNLGVNAYVVKPVDFAQFMEAVREVGLFWLMRNEPPVN